MSFQTRVDQSRVVIQTGANLLVSTSVDNTEARLISLPGPIETFTLSHKSDLVAVLTVDKQWHFYRLSSTLKLECRDTIESRPFQLLALHQDALWLGQVKASPTGPCLSVLVQHLVEKVHYECSVQLSDTFGALELTKYTISEDLLLCVFECARGSVLTNLRLSARRIEHLSSRLLESTFIAKVLSSPDNALQVLLTGRGSNAIHLLDADTETIWHVKPQLQIRSICFDNDFKRLLCVCTDKVLFFLYYIQCDRRIVVLEAIVNKSSHFVVAVRVPTIFAVAANALNSHKCEQLCYLKSDQPAIEHMFGLDHKQFVKRLHNSDSVKVPFWATMAKRCMRENDLDSAIYCAAKMGDARLARDLRREMASEGLVAACSLLALNLGLAEEAEEMVREDTNALSAICQLQNKWNDAFLHAGKIQLKSAYYNYARHLEEANKITDAVKYYEHSGNVLEVPRMLFEAGNIGQLEEYCLKSRNDKSSASLVTWWGQYCESQGDHKTAISMYESVNDYYNLVRLQCHVGQTEKAIQLVNEHLEQTTGRDSPNTPNAQDPMTAAILYLGKHLEALNSTESIYYYLHCGAVRHAIRVCIANELFDQLLTIAVEYSDLKEARNILEVHCRPNQGALNEENLVKLYYKCDLPEEAILLAIHNQAWNQLRDICHNELSQETRQLVVADHILDKAMQALKSDTSVIDIVIDLILMSRVDNFGLISRTIQDYGINLDDNLMDKLERYIANHKNSALVDTFAELCLEKGNYHLAAKLYNKIGKRVDSVKALIRSGNVDKVVQFANVARDKTVFKMAANFLQTVNYEDSSLIVKFYTKAEAYQELDRFKNEMQAQGAPD